MNKKMKSMHQNTFAFEEEPSYVATATSLPPPDAIAPLPPPFVRPDRQITFDGIPHYEWPAHQHDRDSIAVDRIREDIDGPSHRFIIKRGDTVEAFITSTRTSIGEVVGVSNTRQEVRVRFTEGTEGLWFNKGQIYPAIEPKAERPKTGQKLSEVIAEVNGKHGTGLTEADRVPTPDVEPKPIVINDRLIIVPVGFKPTPTAVSAETPISPPAPLSKPFTFDEFKAFHRGMSEGTVSFEKYQEEFQRLIVSEAAIVAELKSRFNAKQLAVLASRMGSWQARGSTKDKNAASVYERMLSAFILDGGVTFQMGERYEDVLKAKVLAVTAGEFYSAIEKRQAKADEHEKALTNPESFFEFRTFLQAKTESDLTDEQLERYDRLHAESTRDRRKSEVSTTVTKFESDELTGHQFEIAEGFHDRRQCPLWIVKLQSRVERSTFNELNIKAKMLGGWYSSFKKSDAGFQFTSKDQADRFASLFSGDADRTDVLEARKERKEQTAAERLHELAAALASRAEDTLTQSDASLQNTARRADIQAGVRGRAFAEQALARTMHSVAEALSRGEAKYLEGIRHRTHIETLGTVLHLAKWARVRAVTRQDGESNFAHGRRLDDEEGRPISAADIRFAEYPFPTLYKRHLEDAIAACRHAKGAKLASERMAKRIRRETDDYITFKQRHDIEELQTYLGRAKGAGYDIERMNDSLEKYLRLQRAGIHDIHELRSALREYLPHLAEARGDDPVKVAERELIGKKLPGFFPTPRTVIRQMLELADIDGRHRVLEPSCGKGDILDALKNELPEASVTAIEQNRTLEDVLSAKGHEVQFVDFLSHQGSYDRIIMNPPFENGQDIDHVRHAFEQLAPGGRLVSVISEGPFFRQDKKSEAFRDWLDESHAELYPLPEDTFTGAEAFRQTGVRTRLVVINRASAGV